MYTKSKKIENREKFTRTCSIASNFSWLDRFQQDTLQQDDLQDVNSTRKHRKKLSDAAQIKKNFTRNTEFSYENHGGICDIAGISGMDLDSKRTKKTAFEKTDEIFINNTVFGSPIELDLDFSCPIDKAMIAEVIFGGHGNNTGFRMSKELSF